MNLNQRVLLLVIIAAQFMPTQCWAGPVVWNEHEKNVHYSQTIGVGKGDVLRLTVDYQEYEGKLSKAWVQVEGIIDWDDYLEQWWKSITRRK